jgi:hypothetical protein
MALSKIEAPSLDVGPLGSRNLLINGDFKISQRGDYTSATSVAHNQLYVDRWVVRLTNVTANIQHILGSHASPNYPYKGSNTLRLTATSTATGLLRHLQRVEGFLDGQTLTFSAWVKSNSPNARLFQYQHDGQYRVSSSAHSGNGQWEFLSVTATNAATTTNNLYFDAAIGSSTFATVSITSGDYIEISEAQVEISDAPTTFEHENIGTTLQKCQRYFQVPFSRLVSGRTDSNWQGNPLNIFNTTRAFTKISLPVTMRALPTATIHNAKFDIAWNNTSRQLTTLPSNVYPDINALGMDLDNSGSGFIVGYSGHVDIGSGCHVTLDAEL